MTVAQKAAQAQLHGRSLSAVKSRWCVSIAAQSHNAKQKRARGAPAARCKGMKLTRLLHTAPFARAVAGIRCRRAAAAQRALRLRLPRRILPLPRPLQTMLRARPLSVLPLRERPRKMLARLLRAPVPTRPPLTRLLPSVGLRRKLLRRMRRRSARRRHFKWATSHWQT